MTLRYAFFHIFLFMCISIMGALALNAFLRVNDLTRFERGRMDFKIDLYLDHFADSDIVFLGTSRTDRQIDIPYFQEQINAAGCSLSAFNLGIPNLTYEEMLYVLSRIKTAQPRYIILEEPIYAQHEWTKIESDRLRSFSTWHGTYQRLQNIWSYQEDVLRKVYRTGVAVTAFAYEQSNLGHFSRLVFPKSNTGGDTIVLPDQLKTGRGYVSMDAQGAVDENIGALHKTFVNKKNEFKKEIENQILAESVYDARYRAKLLENAASKTGATAFLLFPPLVDRVDDNQTLEKALSSKITVLNYNVPSRYPQFWNVDSWYDDGHLNATSAKALTRLVAKDLCAIIERGQ